MDRVQFGCGAVVKRSVCAVIDGIWEQQCVSQWHVRGDDICLRLLPSMSCLTHPLITRTEPTAASHTHNTDACDSHYQVSLFQESVIDFGCTHIHILLYGSLLCTYL